MTMTQLEHWCRCIHEKKVSPDALFFPFFPESKRAEWIQEKRGRVLHQMQGESNDFEPMSASERAV